MLAGKEGQLVTRHEEHAYFCQHVVLGDAGQARELHQRLGERVWGQLALVVLGATTQTLRVEVGRSGSSTLHGMVGDIISHCMHSLHVLEDAFLELGVLGSGIAVSGERLDGKMH
jgi:hypothetical protein